MRDVRNPFRLQTAERIDSDTDFLRLFGHGVLDLLPRDPFGGPPLTIRSAPGGGKTSLLKLFTPSVLQTLVARRTDDSFKDLFNKMKGLGAVSDSGATVLSVMLSCSRTFPALGDVELQPVRARRLLFALIDARVVLGALRAILVSRGLCFPDDLKRLTLVDSLGDHVPGLLFPSDGATVRRWAHSIEQGIADVIDSIIASEGAGPSGHDVLLSLRLLDADCIMLDGKPLAIRWLVAFDDVHSLSTTQRRTLNDVIAVQRARTPVWLAERLEAMSQSELLSPGALPGRDTAVINIETEWIKGRRFEQTVGFIAEQRARMAAESAGPNAPSGFAPTVEASLGAAWHDKTLAALEVVRLRVEDMAVANPLYSDWVKSRSNGSGVSRDQLLSWRVLEILIAREERKSQRELVLEPLSQQELAHKDGSDVRAAAELFLSKEFGFPYYFGLSRLAQLGFANVEQFLFLAGDLFEESLAAAVMRQPTLIAPERQERIVELAYEKRIANLAQRARNGRDVLRFLDSVGRFCHDATHQPNAPYSPGVTGIAILMSERKSLLDPSYQAMYPPAATFAAILETALAHNLLRAEFDRSVKNNLYMVLFLNRLLCPKYKLPLHYGGYREKQLSEFINWAVHGYRAPESETLLW